MKLFSFALYYFSMTSKLNDFNKPSRGNPGIPIFSLPCLLRAPKFLDRCGQLSHENGINLIGKLTEYNVKTLLKKSGVAINSNIVRGKFR